MTGSSVVDAAAGDRVDVGIGVGPGQERRLVLAKKGVWESMKPYYACAQWTARTGKYVGIS